jgi:hypothetical protein
MVSYREKKISQRISVMDRTASDRAWDMGRGAAGGAVLLAAVGFMWGGWTTQGTHLETVKSASSNAVVAALAPICADSFSRGVNANEQKTEMMKVSSWNRGDFIAKGGWATAPGSTAPNNSVAKACAELLSK